MIKHDYKVSVFIIVLPELHVKSGVLAWMFSGFAGGGWAQSWGFPHLERKRRVGVSSLAICTHAFGVFFGCWYSLGNYFAQIAWFGKQWLGLRPKVRFQWLPTRKVFLGL